MSERILVHEVTLDGYKATADHKTIDFGTWGSYGIEKLHLNLGKAWEGLVILAHFNVKGEVVATALADEDNMIEVPWEALKDNTFAGRIVFQGDMNGARRLTANLNFKVTNHADFVGSDPVPTDDKWNQFVGETKGYRDDAVAAADAAKKSEANVEGMVQTPYNYIDESLRTWLDDHPEATTTVQDGSLTYEKFESTQKKLLESSTKIYVETIGIETTNTGHDNTTKLANALANAAYNTNVEYIFSNGIYKFDDTITLKGNAILTGENNSTLSYVGTADTFIIITSMNCKMRDLYVSDTTGMEKSVTTGIQVGTLNAYASHVCLSNLFITGFKIGLKTVNTWIDTFNSISCNFCQTGYSNDGTINAATFIRLNTEGNVNGINIKGISLGLSFLNLCCEGNTTEYVEISSSGTITFISPYFESQTEESGSGCVYLISTGSCLITIINPLISYSCPFFFEGTTPKIIGSKNATIYVENPTAWYPVLSQFNEYFIGVSSFKNPLYNSTAVVSNVENGIEVLDNNNYYSYGTKNANDIRFNANVDFAQSMKRIEICINNASQYNGRYFVIDVESNENLYGANSAYLYQLYSGDTIKSWNKSVDYSSSAKSMKYLFDHSTRFQFYFLVSDVDNRSSKIYGNISFFKNVFIRNIAIVDVVDSIV